MQHQKASLETKTQNALTLGEVSTTEIITLHIDSLLLRAFEQSLSPGQSAEEAIRKHIAHTVAARLMHEHPDIFQAIESGEISFDQGIKKSLDGPPPSCVTGKSIKAGTAAPKEVSEMATGTLKFWKADKGFGFLQRDDGGPDVFVHMNQLSRTGITELRADDVFQFDVGSNPRDGRQQAVNLVLLGRDKGRAA
jgi:CspA family cold shock protein